MNWTNLFFICTGFLLAGCVNTTPVTIGPQTTNASSDQNIAELNAISLEGKLAIIKRYNGKSIQVDHFYITGDSVYFIRRKTKEEGELLRENVKAVIIKTPRNAMVLSGGGILFGAALMSENAAGRDNLYEGLASGLGGGVLMTTGLTVVILGIIGSRERYAIN